MTIPKEMLREYIKGEDFKSTTDIMSGIKDLFAQVLQGVMEAELETTLGYGKQERRAPEETGVAEPTKGRRNYRNGYTGKTVKTELGEVPINVPRDRLGEYKPQIIEPYCRNADGMEEKILALYACGMSQHDIAEQIKGLYDVEISPELVSKISEKILPDIAAWQNRSLDEVYPFVFMDAIHYKVREDRQVVTKAAYVVLGVNMEGRKEILGIWIGASESSKFWLSVMNELKSRGVKEVYLFCVDGLNGFREAIAAAYPRSDIQRCIIHQIRSSTKYVNWKDMKAFMADLKRIYGAITEGEARLALDELSTKWGKRYPSAVKSWVTNWDILSTFFRYPPEIRRIIYTTNAIEGLHRQFRKITKTKGSFPSDQSLMKMLYLAARKIEEKWTVRYRDWDRVIAALSIMKEEEALCTASISATCDASLDRATSK